MLSVLCIEGAEIGSAVGTSEPRPPVSDISGIADAIWPPAVVGVADIVVIVSQGDSQTAVAIPQPVLAAGVMDEYELDGGFRRTDVIKWHVAPCLWARH
jgi:hypothetical protein